jgi:hypothetical protein
MAQKQERTKAAGRMEEKGDSVRSAGTPVFGPNFDDFIVELNDLITMVAVDLGSKKESGSRRHLRPGK